MDYFLIFHCWHLQAYFLGCWFDVLILQLFVEVTLASCHLKCINSLVYTFLYGFCWLMKYTVRCNSYESLLGLQIPNCFGLQLCFFEVELGLLVQKYWFIFSCHALLFYAIAGIRRLRINWNYELQVIGFWDFLKMWLLK